MFSPEVIVFVNIWVFFSQLFQTIYGISLFYLLDLNFPESTLETVEILKISTTVRIVFYSSLFVLFAYDVFIEERFILTQGFDENDDFIEVDRL